MRLAGRTVPSGLAPPDVTRLASLGGLDRLGFQVWQAVRPLGRSLSCHMGKGMDEAQAIASALGEARECADCEAYLPVRVRCRWTALPADERTASPDDFAVRRGAIEGDDVLDWTRIESLAGPCLWVPSDTIAIDFTKPRHPAVVRSTTGQATGNSFPQAMRRALLERIERDAVARHRALRPGARRAWAIDPDTVPFDWFQNFLTRARRLRMSVGIDQLPAIGELPAYQLTITEADKPGAACRYTGGWGAAFTTSAALQAAMLEAVQSRVGYIAGARDDIDLEPSPPVDPPDWLLASASRRFIVAGEEPVTDEAAIQALSSLLAAAHFPRIGFVIASAADSSYVTVKCFVPGLAQGECAAMPRC